VNQVLEYMKYAIVQTEWADTICQKGRKRAVGYVRADWKWNIVKPNVSKIGPAIVDSLLPKPCHQIDLTRVQVW